MTREQIQAMTDSELTASVAEKVMAWPQDAMTWNMSVELDGITLFRPLTDWNHTFQIVEAMRARGFFLDINGTDVSTECGFVKGDNHWSRRTTPGDERRAILEAALLAMEREPCQK